MSETATAILTAAKRLFAKGGPEAVTVRATAMAVGVTPMAIYRHYPGTSGLLDAITKDGLFAWERRVAKLKAAPPKNWIEDLAAAYLDFALDAPRSFEAAFLLPAQGARRYPDDFANDRSPAGTVVLAKVKEAITAGTLGGARPLDIALALWASAHGLIVLYRSGRFALDEAAFRALYIDAVGRALTSYVPKAGRKTR